MYSARPPTGSTESGPERAAEDVHEQQQEDDRDAGDEEDHRVAAHVAEVAPQHGRRVGDVGRERVHRAAAFRSSLWPVRDRNTSSRSGVSTDSPPTVDRRGVEPVEEAPQRADAAVARDLEGQRLVVARGAPSNARAALSSAVGVGELEPDVTARDQPLELVRRPLGDDLAAVEHGDPIGEPVRLLEVLRRQEDRDAAWRRGPGRSAT